MLTNSLYVGMVPWQGDIHQGEHEPLISRVLFERVQEKLQGRGHVQTKPQFPYRGLLVCGRCGCHLTAAIAKRKYVYLPLHGSEGRLHPDVRPAGPAWGAARLRRRRGALDC